MASASPRLRKNPKKPLDPGKWSLVYRWRGKSKSRKLGIQHDGKYKDGVPVPPKAVVRELHKLLEELEQGKAPSNQTVPHLLDLVEKEYEVTGFKSVGALKSRMKHIREWFGNLKAEQVGKNDFLEYADHRQKEGAANATIKRELEVIRKGLKMGELMVPAMPKLVLPKPRQGFFDDAKIAAVCHFLPEYLRAPFLFGYYTGWRREEVFGLEWKDVDLKEGEVRLWESKNGEPRVFPIDVVPALRTLLEELKTKRVQPTTAIVVAISPWVFTHTRKKSGRVRRIVDFRKALETACIKAGCPGMIFHDLRRSAARNLELAGWHRSAVMAWMGHETEAMFHRYRIQSAADREIVQKRLAERAKTQ